MPEAPASTPPEDDIPVLAQVSEAEVRHEWGKFYKPSRQLIIAIAVAEPKEADDGLEEHLMRLRVHNREVLRLLAEAQNDPQRPWAKVVKYLKGGVLLSADPQRASKAVALAVDVMRAFDNQPGSVWGIRPMIGIASGDVIDLAAAVPADPQGAAVDRAVRFVSEVATPNQILLETQVVSPEDLAHGVTLEPLDGKQKALAGPLRPVTISEVVWREVNGPIINRFELSADLLKIQRATLDLLTTLNELQWDHRANIYKSTLDDGEIDRFKRQVEGLERFAFKELDKAWASAYEAQDDDQLSRYLDDVRTTYRDVLNAFAAYLGSSSEKNQAVGDLRDAWSPFTMAVNGLSDVLQGKMQGLRVTHV